ncbi:hypothetical protein EUGRSUZ_C02314 [Eucalyptus grandis]|uniref:Uncharacterized protein n=2 Tax=Eucalyptus grandis TaxID=71139 RepID=A0ACC3LFI0_EUCGR|nr:hypothetical protein EUGRSUZ_C02314 [Eucalyptus grandis]
MHQQGYCHLHIPQRSTLNILVPLQPRMKTIYLTMMQDPISKTLHSMRSKKLFSFVNAIPLDLSLPLPPRPLPRPLGDPPI